MNVELGIIEGFYGRPWSWEAREATVAALAPHGYRFYLYAPKGDPFLRRRWHEQHPEPMAAGLEGLAARCRDAGVRFGVGISPFELYLRWDRSGREALARKLEYLDALGVADLAILFDDMRGDVDGLADLQAEIVGWAADHTAADRVLMCPTYYSDDPVLDRVFGRRPGDYLARLGTLLPLEIEIFWTGEEVCAREMRPGHLRQVAEIIGRKPFLWDNYPVNDGQRMSRFLHLRAFSGRPASIAEHVSGHGINPALQPTLSRIPALTLPESYRMADEYAYGEALRRAAAEVLGEDLGRKVWEDVLTLQDVGLGRLDEERERWVRDRYTDVDHPGAREIIGWLDGEYDITDEIVRTQ